MMRWWPRSAIVVAFVAVTGLVGSVTAAAVVARKPEPTWQTNDEVQAVAVAGGRIYIAGTFTQLRSPDGSQTVTRNRIAALNAATGMVDATFNPNADNTVSALAVSADGSTVYAGGSFATIGGASRRRLAALDAITGAALPGWKADVSGTTVEALRTAGSLVYVGGNFSGVGGVPRSHLAAVHQSSGTVNDTWNPSASARVRALTVGGGTVFAGGDFSRVGGGSSSRLAGLDPTSGALSATFRASARVYGLTSNPNAPRIYAAIGGAGGTCASFASGGGDALWSIQANGNVRSVALLNGLVYCGGHFGGTSSFGGQTRYKLAAADPGTGAVAEFAPRFNSSRGVLALTSTPSYLYAGGDFTRVTGVYQQGFAQFPEQH
jgi:beta-propeller uncharacterized protein DUF5122